MDFGARLKLLIEELQFFFCIGFIFQPQSLQCFSSLLSFVSLFPIPTIPAVSVLLNAYMSKHIF